MFSFTQFRQCKLRTSQNVFRLSWMRHGMACDRLDVTVALIKFEYKRSERSERIQYQFYIFTNQDEILHFRFRHFGTRCRNWVLSWALWQTSPSWPSTSNMPSMLGRIVTNSMSLRKTLVHECMRHAMQASKILLQSNSSSLIHIECWKIWVFNKKYFQPNFLVDLIASFYTVSVFWKIFIKVLRSQNLKITVEYWGWGS